MDTKTKGAWIIHHTKKLQAVTSQDFDQLAFSGKCGLLLSGIAASFQTTISKARLEALARSSNISPRAELPTILEELARQSLITKGKTHIEILGLSTHAVLNHTATIFHESSPNPEELAAIEIAEAVSERPISESELCMFTSDTFKIRKRDAEDLLKKGEGIGFFDAESDGGEERLVFNGNLFRSDDLRKISAVVNTLSQDEAGKFRELNDLLSSQGCITLNSAYRIVGTTLFKKLHAVGFYDVNTVGNENGIHYFVTKPAAFSKFTSSIADDAFDLAKAFVSALTYGMTSSASTRGRIQMISLLMNKLISGDWVGPATAIGQDYQALELRGVIEVKASSGTMYVMRLLKREVGKLALSVIQEGGITADSIERLPSAAVSSYVGPEENRTITRKNITEPLKRSVGTLLTELRTGGIKR